MFRDDISQRDMALMGDNVIFPPLMARNQSSGENAICVFRVLESERVLTMRRRVPEGDGTFWRRCDESLVLW